MRLAVRALASLTLIAAGIGAAWATLFYGIYGWGADPWSWDWSVRVGAVAVALLWAGKAVAEY